MSVLHRYGLGALGIVLFLLIWEVAGQRLGAALLAPPSQVFPELVNTLTTEDTLYQLFNSLRQMFMGYVLAFVVAVPLGILMSRSSLVDAIVHPWVSMLLVTSIASLVPLLVISCGNGFAFRVAVVFLASAWYMLLIVYNAARGIETGYIDVARSFTANRYQIFTKVLFPALVPYILIAARIGLVHAIRAMVLAELFISTGFGRLLFLSGLSISTAPGLALLLILMIVSIIATQIIERIGSLLSPWYASQAAAVDVRQR